MSGAKVATGDRESVLESKVRAPHTLGATVQRTQLLKAMADASDGGCAFTMIVAPAGAGKTMLMAQRSEQLRAAQIPAAWLSLDAADNDPAIFWAGVLASCAKALHDHGAAAEEAFAALDPPARAGDRGFLAALFAVIERLPRGLHLVLDDVHEIEPGDVLGELRQLLRSAPSQLGVMLGCRHDPPLPIPRLILEGRASEIRADDLAFAREEARELLAGHDVSLTEPDLDLLLARTEGWVAGLRLAAMSLRHQPDKSAYVASFAGTDRPVMDYLMTEVLAIYPAETVSLLLATAVPDLVIPELAAELTGRPDAGRILDGLARDNALVYRANSTPASYRYHPLLRGFLLAELSRRDSGAAREIHRTATDWFADRGAPLAALDHAAEARDWDRVADLLDQHGLQLLMTGDAGRLSGLLNAAAVEDSGRPALSLIAAIAALQDGRFGLAASHLDRVGRDPSVHSDSRLRLLHAATVMYEARISGVRDPDVIAPLVKACDGNEYVADPLYGLLATANRGMLRMLMGEFAKADIDLRAALRLAQQGGWHFLTFDCLTHLAGNAAGLNDFAKLAAWSAEAIAFANERGWSTSSRLPQAYVAAAWASWQMMDAEAAERYVSLASAIDADVEPEAALSTHVVGLFVEFVGAPDRRAVLGKLRSVWAEAAAPEWLTAAMVAAFCLTELQMALSIAEPTWAAETARRAERFAGDGCDVIVMRAWIHLYHGRNNAARSALAPVLSGNERCYVISSEITAWLLEAHMAATNSEHARSHDALVRAIELAAPRRALRDMANASSRVRALLIHSRGRFGTNEEFVAEVLEVSGSATAGGGTLAGEAFTARELELLRDLPSMLSHEEIAHAHVVSVNTVKTHLKALYRKLGVNTRREAVERARAIGLI